MLTTKNEQTQAKRNLETEFLWEQNQNKTQTQNKTNQQKDTLPKPPQYALWNKTANIMQRSLSGL